MFKYMFVALGSAILLIGGAQIRTMAEKPVAEKPVAEKPVEWVKPEILKKLQDIQPCPKCRELSVSDAMALLTDRGAAVNGWGDEAVFTSATETNVNGMLQDFHPGESVTLHDVPQNEAVYIFKGKMPNGVTIKVAANKKGQVIARQKTGDMQLLVPAHLRPTNPGLRPR
jgi:hypothetical protein